MQRILERGEIESTDHTQIPRVQLPDSSSVFVDRAARLRQLAKDHSLAGYLNLMAHVADAQHKLLGTVHLTPVPTDRLERAQAHGMPPLQAVGWQRGAEWLEVLDALLKHLTQVQPPLPDAAQQVVLGLRQAVATNPAGLEELADDLLAERDQNIDTSAAPFVMAALQVYWTAMAAHFELNHLPVVSPFGVCPVCASLPVASVVRVGGARDSCRYLCCSLCSTEWHLVRVTCSHCEDTESIAYHRIEEGHEGIKAESCDKCKTYRKIFYQEKDLHIEPVADDLGSLSLDILMGDAGYMRASGNPLLWQDGAD